MKKSAVFILILLVLPIISAVEVEMKTDFSQGETLLARVSGNFIDTILKENIYFYRGHVRSPTEYDVTKIQGEYYIYASLLDKSPNNYSMVIKDVQYMKGSQVSEEGTIKTFSVNENMADFLVEPGFIVSSDNYFIEVQNLQDSKITITAKVLIKNETSEEPGFFASLFGSSGGEVEQEKSVTLLSGEIKKINFEIGDLKSSTFKTIELSTNNLKYEIPAYLFLEGEQSEEKEIGFKFEPHYLNVSVSTNSNANRIVYLKNVGEEILENISISLSDSLKPYANLSIENLTNLKENSSSKIEISFFSENVSVIEGYLKAQTSDKIISAYLEINLDFLEDYTPPSNGSSTTITKTCLELNGTICEKNQECKGESVNSKNAVCCLGICEEKKRNPAGAIIGWGIIILVLSFLAWFFIKRYRKPRKKVDLLKIAGEKRYSPRRTFTRQIPPRTITKVVEKPVVKIVEKPVVKTITKVVEKPKPVPPKYVGSSQTNTYHKSSCKFAGLIKEDYKMSNDDSNFFKKLGYKPCKSCLG
ncbi:hypothetical protein KAJ87_02705 [Candidatus Pacearchaeota archaeon]|nr:hypothetical protein [Candidatus Pacearchaeota archaeon]